MGAARPLRTLSSGRQCIFCADKFLAGVEAYGGLGDTWDLSLHDTSHYIAPTARMAVALRPRLVFSPGFGLTSTSLDRVYRFGRAVELPQVGSWFRSNKGGAR